MKPRKHKSNKPFIITFQTRSFPVVKNKNNVGGYKKRGEQITFVEQIRAEGISAGAVRAGFLFGRDRNNPVFNITPA